MDKLNSRDFVQNKSPWVIAIEKFEQKLCEPLIPSFKNSYDKLLSWLNSCEIRNRVFALLFLLLMLMYAMMGLWGTITFLLGVASVITLEAVLAFFYIATERKRATQSVDQQMKDAHQHQEFTKLYNLAKMERSKQESPQINSNSFASVKTSPKLQQDQPPASGRNSAQIRMDPDMFSDSGSQLRTTKFQFTNDGLELPDNVSFHMLTKCKCRRRFNKEIIFAFEMKFQRMDSFLSLLKEFFQSNSRIQVSIGQTYSKLGFKAVGWFETKSLLPMESQLFEQEFTLSNNHSDNFKMVNILQIQQQYNRLGENMTKAQDGVLSFLENCLCNELQVKLKKLAENFKIKNQQLHGELKLSEASLRKLELDFKQNEQKFLEMVADYNVQIGKTQQLSLVDDALSSTANNDNSTQTLQVKKRTKNYAEIVQLECQCKLARHQLVNQANLIKDEYSHLKEVYGNMVQFRDEFMQDLVEIQSEKGQVFNELLAFYYSKSIDVEKTSFQFLSQLTKQAEQCAMVHKEQITVPNLLPQVDDFSSEEEESEDADLSSDSDDDYEQKDRRKSKRHFLGDKIDLTKIIEETSIGSVDFKTSQRGCETHCSKEPKSAGSGYFGIKPSLKSDQSLDQNKSVTSKASKRSVRKSASEQNVHILDSFSVFCEQNKFQAPPNLTTWGLDQIATFVGQKQIEIDKAESEFKDVISFLKEFSEYGSYMLDLFQNYNQSQQKLISEQFKEVKNVKTGVTISVEEIDGLNEDSLQSTKRLAMMKRVSESHKYGPVQITLKMMDHDQLIGEIWNDFMEVQKGSNEQNYLSCEIMKSVSQEMSKQILQSQELISNETLKIKDTITLIFTNIAEAEQLESKIKFMNNYVGSTRSQQLHEEDGQMAQTKSSFINKSLISPEVQRNQPNQINSISAIAPSIQNQKTVDFDLKRLIQVTEVDESEEKKQLSVKNDPVRSFKQEKSIKNQGSDDISQILSSSDKNESQLKHLHISNEDFGMVVSRQLKKNNTGNLLSAQPDKGDISAGVGEFTFKSGMGDFSLLTKKHLRVNLQNHRPGDEVDSPGINLSPRSAKRSLSPRLQNRQIPVSPRMMNLLSVSPRMSMSPRLPMSPRIGIKADDEVSLISMREFTGSVRERKLSLNKYQKNQLTYDDIKKVENLSENTGGGLSFWNRVSAIFENPVANIGLAVTSEENLPPIEDLKRQLAAERQELEDNVSNLIDLTRCMRMLINQKRQELFFCVQSWKKEIVLCQIEKSRSCIQLLSRTVGLQTKYEGDNIAEVSQVFKKFDSENFEYHEQHCQNFTIDIGQENEVNGSQLGDADGFPQVMQFTAIEEICVQSPQKLGPGKEGTFWLNKLVEVLFEAWKTAEVFHKLIADVSYVSLNQNRLSSLGELKIVGLKLEGKSPELLWLSKTKQADMQPSFDPSKKTFCYDGELSFLGKIKLLITTSYKIHWPAENWYTLPIKLEIIVGRISGKIRIQYSTDPAMGSFFQFLGRPAAKIEVEPVVGEESSINLKSLPRVTTIITDLVNKEIDNLCFPGSLKMDIPCTTESTEIDKNGVPIKKAKQFNVLEQNDQKLVDKIVEELRKKDQTFETPIKPAQQQAQMTTLLELNQSPRKTRRNSFNHSPNESDVLKGRERSLSNNSFIIPTVKRL